MTREELREFILDALRRDDEAQARVQAWRKDCRADGLGFDGLGPWQRSRPAHLRPDTGKDPTVTERYARVLEAHRALLESFGITRPATLKEIADEARMPARANRPRNRYYKGTRRPQKSE